MRTGTRLPSSLISVIAICIYSQHAMAQGGKVTWIKEKIDEINVSKQAKLAVATEAGDPKSHAASPSIDSAGPSIVDRSNPTEFANVALALANNRGTSASGMTTGTVTTTLYGVLAAVQKKSLIDPDFYRDQRHLRKVSFTIGTASSTKAKDGTTTDAAVYGFQLKVFDGTDIYRGGKNSIYTKLVGQFKSSTSDVELSNVMTATCARLDPSLINCIAAFATSASTEAWFQGLPAAEKDDIRSRLERVAVEDAALLAFIGEVRKSLEKPRQLTIAYFTSQRKDGGADDHRAELIYDYGIHKLLNWTINAGMEYRNVYKKTGGDRKGARFATEMQYKLYGLDKQSDAVNRWITFDFGGEWKASTGAKPYIKGQAKLTVPLMEGISLPIVWSYESNTEMQLANATLSGPAQKKFHFGLAFDPGKLKGLVK